MISPKGEISFTDLQRTEYLALIKKHGKKEKVAWALFLLLGIFGAHRFYLGYYRSGLIMLVLTVFTLGLLAPIVLFDARRITELTWNANYEHRLWAVKHVKRKYPL